MGLKLSHVGVIEYPRRVETANIITHAIPAVLSLPAFFVMLRASLLSGIGARAVVSAVLYGLSITAVYGVSVLYHALPVGEKKNTARLLDHSTVPLLIAGTAAPCALVTLYELSPVHGIAVCITGWLCYLFGVVSKLFFFERLKVVTMAVYILGGAVMLLSAVPRLGDISRDGFLLLVIGCVLYLIGALFCGLGAKKSFLHPVFHVLVALASAVHWYSIFVYIFNGGDALVV